MTKRFSGWVLGSLLAFGTMPAATPGADLSRYRDFQLGADLAAVTAQTGVRSAQVKTIHTRPVLMQELEWRPRALGWSAKSEPVQKVLFSFYDGQLYRIVIDYDQNSTEGLTEKDVVNALSEEFGEAVKPPASTNPPRDAFGNTETVLVRWQDSQYRFDLIRNSYGPSFRLVGVLKKLEAPVQAATLEAKRLDRQEAPQREADRLASEDEAATAALEKARQVNKPKFRP
ncbi:MAG: hypothetical protein IPM24_25565 [Bryobacterales bacterium]|nr:hypothetical protein [Bryobacterales bacterium]